MNKKSSKAAGKIFLAFTAVIAIATMIFASYMGGQKKIVEKFYTSLVRSDSAGVTGCYPTDYGAPAGVIIQEMRERYFSSDAGSLEKDGSIVHVRINYISRDMSDLSTCDYSYTVTYYNDDSDSFTTAPKTAGLVRRGFSWRISAPDHQVADD